jgi:hypothetical protein
MMRMLLAALLLVASVGAARAQSAYAAMVAASPNIVNYWALSANANDAIGTANGTCGGGCAYGAALGSYLSGASLNGTENSYVTVPVQYPGGNAGFAGDYSWAWEMWTIQPSGNTAGSCLLIGTHEAFESAFYVGIAGSACFTGLCPTGDAVAWGVDSIGHVICSSSAVNDGNLHQFVGSYVTSTQTLSLFVDTVLIGTTTFQTLFDTGPAPAPMAFGNGYPTSESQVAPGPVGAYAFYASTLSAAPAISAATILAHYNCGKFGLCAGGGIQRGGGGGIVE